MSGPGFIAPEEDRVCEITLIRLQEKTFHWDAF